MLNECIKYYGRYVKDVGSLNNPKVRLKIKHMYEVKNISIKIAENIGLDEEKVELAGAIGLLHDIGRFTQVLNYNTFDDSVSIDHAQAAIDILFTEGYIEKFLPFYEKYYDIVKKAIYYHNKLNVSDDLNKDEEIFVKLIRDADKIDIYRVMTKENFEDVFRGKITNSLNVSRDVEYDFYDMIPIDSRKIKNIFDDFVLKLAYVYDFNYDISKKMLLDFNYYKDFLLNFTNKVYSQTGKYPRKLYYMYVFASKYLLNS